MEELPPQFADVLPRLSHDGVRGHLLSDGERVPLRRAVKLPQIPGHMLVVVDADVLQGSTVHRRDDLVIGQCVPPASLQPGLGLLVLGGWAHRFLDRPRARLGVHVRVHEEGFINGTVLGDASDSFVIKRLLDVLLLLCRLRLCRHYAGKVSHGRVQWILKSEPLLLLVGELSILVPRRIQENRVIVTTQEHNGPFLPEFCRQFVHLLELLLALIRISCLVHEGQRVVVIKSVIEPPLDPLEGQTGTTGIIPEFQRVRGVRLKLG